MGWNWKNVGFSDDAMHFNTIWGTDLKQTKSGGDLFFVVMEDLLLIFVDVINWALYAKNCSSVFICGLFNSGSLNSIKSWDEEWIMICKVCRREPLWHKTFAWRNRTKHGKPQDHWSLDQDSNPGSSKYEALHCSVVQDWRRQKNAKRTFRLWCRSFTLSWFRLYCIIGLPYEENFLYRWTL